MQSVFGESDKDLSSFFPSCVHSETNTKPAVAESSEDFIYNKIVGVKLLLINLTFLVLVFSNFNSIQ